MATARGNFLGYARPGYDSLDRCLNLLLQTEWGRTADQDLLIIKPMEADRIGETAAADAVKKRERCTMKVSQCW